MTELVLKISQNYNNKLNCKIFHTFRLYTPEKWDFYNSNLLKTFQILLDGQPYSKAKLIFIKSTPYGRIPLETLMVDTGYSTKLAIDQLFRSFGIGAKDEVIWLYFKKVIS